MAPFSMATNSNLGKHSRLYFLAAMLFVLVRGDLRPPDLPADICYGSFVSRPNTSAARDSAFSQT